MEHEDIAVKLAEVDARCRSNTHRLDAVEKNSDALHELATSVKVMANELKRQGDAVEEIKDDVTNLGHKVDSIEKKPGKRWESIVDKLIWGVVGAVLALLLAKIGL